MVGDLFMGAKPVVLLVEGIKIDRRSEPNSYLLAAAPVAEYLFWQVVAEPRNKNRNYLRAPLVDYLANARLSRQHFVGTAFQISAALGMEADDVSAAFRTQLYEATK